jgi:ligand-binding sensor domain-containing protein
MYVGGATGGSIIVSGFDVMSSFLLVLTGPEQTVPINVPETSDPVPASQGLIADANGWWVASLDGLYLWTPHTGGILVSESLAAPAGACA